MSPVPAIPAPAGRRAALLSLVCLALAVVLPTFSLVGLLTTSTDAWLAKLGTIQTASAALRAWPVSPWQTGLAVLLGMLPVSAMTYGLLRARQCLLALARGETFGRGTVRHLRGFAAAVFAAAMTGLVLPPLIGVLLTLQAPAGQRNLTLSIGSDTLLMMLFAGIVWQVAHVMSQAADLADEHAKIV